VIITVREPAVQWWPKLPFGLRTRDEPWRQLRASYTVIKRELLEHHSAVVTAPAARRSDIGSATALTHKSDKPAKPGKTMLVGRTDLLVVTAANAWRSATVVFHSCRYLGDLGVDLILFYGGRT
jgi:hypothetical protein